MVNMMNDGLKESSIIADTDGLILRIQRVIGESVEAQYLAAPITRTIPIKDVRLLTNSERQPLVVNADFEELIHERDTMVANYLARPSRGTRAKKEPTLFDSLKKAKSPEETAAILKSHGVAMQQK